MSMWTLENQQRAPVTVAALEDTVAADPAINYHDVELQQYTDTLSHRSFESQTAMVTFSLSRADSVGSILSELDPHVGETHSVERTPSLARASPIQPTQSVGASKEGQLGEIRKKDLAAMLERGISTFKPV